MMLIIFSDRPCSPKSFHKLSWCKQSKAFSKSTKLKHREICHSNDWPMMFRNAKVWSQHDLPGLNPACFFLSSASTWCFPLSKTAYEKNILLVDKGVIPRQLFYSVLSPISGNSSFFHSGHHFIESWIPPVLDASSALQALILYFFVCLVFHSFTSTSFVPVLSSSPLT